MPPDFMDPPEGVDVDAHPTFAEVVDARDGRVAYVRGLIDTFDEKGLGCLRVVLDEEWAHNWFAHRDLDVLTSGG